MRNLKKFLALVLAFVMAMSLMVTVSASSFEDDGEITPAYAEAVDVLTELGVINGYDNDGVSTFDPKATITRAEVAAILYRIVTGDVGDKNIHLYENSGYFSDVAEGKWYNGYVNYCANNGLVVGVGGDRFAPSDPVTGYETLVMILRAMGYNYSAEFTGSDWKLKASGYGTRLGITKNIGTGSLGGNATREMVAEIMFQAIQAPTVTYSTLLGYSTDLLVRASDYNGDGTLANRVYANDVPNTLMYQTFQIVGKRTILADDNYGRPVVEWVRDAADDTVENGGKYIVNPQTATMIEADMTTFANGVAGGRWVVPGASYIPSNTPAATFAQRSDDGNGYNAAARKIDRTVLSITMTPVYTFYDVMTECNLTKAINNDKSINTATSLTEWLNGAKVALRGDDNGNGAIDGAETAYIMDALHTATGDNNPTVGAPGRTTEVYRIGSNPDGTGIFVFVYVDTMMGVVQGVVNRTYDTAGHVMTPAKLTIKVNETVNSVVYSDYTRDFTEYKSGDLILLTTWGGHNWGANVNGAPSGTDSGKIVKVENLQTTVPQDTIDFRWKDDDPTTAAVDIVGKPNTETFTVNATVGALDSKTGLISTDNGTYMGNVVYLANQEDPTGTKGTDTDTPGTPGNGAPTYYNKDGGYDNLITTETTVPETGTDYGVAMTNARIGQTVTAVRDPRGYVVGLTMSTVSSDVGVIMGMDSVRVATGKYAVEAELLMMDGSTKTVRFLDNQDQNYNDSTEYKFFSTQANADLAITDATKIANVSANTLVQIKPFTKEGATYYKVTATDNGTGINTKFPTKNLAADPVNDPAILVPDVRDVYDHKVQTGVADTLTGHNTKTDTTWAASHGVAATLAANIENIDDNTKFIVAEYDYRYNQGEANEGGYTDLVYKTYTGFKNLPTITGADHEVKFQKVGNNVFIHPELDPQIVAVAARRFTLRAAPTYAVDETYLVLATIATYADHATYKALKDGVETTLEVANNNLTTVNNDIETAMAAGNLIYVDSKNAAGYATSVKVLSGSTYTLAAIGSASRTIAAADVLKFAKTGVLFNDHTDGHFIGGDIDAAGATTATWWLTMADNCKVVIVNLINGTYVEGTLDSIMQYENYTDGVNDSHKFVYELDANGYVSTLYIID